MSREEQEDLMRGLAARVVDQAVEDLQNTKATEDWKGPDLRQYLAYLFQQETSKDFEKDYKRLQDFRNTIATTNL